SPRKGQSVEFSDYRPYGIGDDLRYVDWNIFGRLDRLHVKLFVDEEDLCLHLLVDASRSMGFGQPQKLEYAARLAAALGFVGLVNHERVGLGILRDRVSEGWSPVRGRNQFPHLADFLSQVTRRRQPERGPRQLCAPRGRARTGRRDLGSPRSRWVRSRVACIARAPLRGPRDPAALGRGAQSDADRRSPARGFGDRRGA